MILAGGKVPERPPASGEVVDKGAVVPELVAGTVVAAGSDIVISSEVLTESTR